MCQRIDSKQLIVNLSKRTIHLVQNNKTVFAEGNALYSAFNETNFIRKMTDLSQEKPVVYARHMPFVDFENATFFPAMQRIFKLHRNVLFAEKGNKNKTF